ncbi:glycosyltransferase family 2 protein [Facklamia sp. P13055]|uniref:glycosyltransferase family 2 protein n=1 Tax=Facklamia sp. P13055 TaxID=3421952 RepID=UPI003D17F842
MLNQELVSVIIPVYNSECYIESTLMSVLKQTYRNIELIIVNDGSTDKSVETIKSTTKDFYHKVHLIHQENSGQSVARNVGIKNSKGKYIYFLDSDDILKIDAIEIMVKKINEYSSDILMFSGSSFIESKEKSYHDIGNYLKNSTYLNPLPGEQAFINLIKNNDYSPSPCLLFIRKKHLDFTNLEFFPGIIQEDELFTFELLLNSKNVRVINDILFFRRLREGSTMTGYNYSKSYLGYYTVFKKIYNSYYKDCKKTLKKYIKKKLSHIYSNAINQYLKLSKDERNYYYHEISEIKKINRENLYFYRIDFFLFDISSTLYKYIRYTFKTLFTK